MTIFSSKLKSAIVAFGLQSVTQRVIVLVSQVALARFLLPSDFGQVGIAYAVTSIPASFANFGIDDVLIQRRRALRFWSGPATRLSLVLGALLSLLVIAMAPFVASLYGSPQLTFLLMILGACISINAFATVPTARMRATLNFRMQAIINLLEVLAASLCALILAYYSFGPFSIVLPAPFVAVLRTAFLWHRFPNTSPPRAFGYCKYLISRSLNVLLHRVLTSVMTQYPILLVGFAASSEAAGIYYFAYKVAVQPILAIAGIFQGLFFPLLMHLKHDFGAQERMTIKVIRVLNFLTMTFGSLVAAIAWPAVQTLFDDKWLAAAPSIAILSVGVAFDTAAWIAGALLSARGQFHRALLYTACTAPIYFAAITIGVLSATVRGASLGFAAAYVVIGPLFVYLSMHRFHVGHNLMKRLYLVPIISSLVPLLICKALQGALEDHLGPAATMIALASVYAVSAIAICLAMRENFVTDIVAISQSRKIAD